jgi:hypothetical protein
MYCHHHHIICQLDALFRPLSFSNLYKVLFLFLDQCSLYFVYVSEIVSFRFVHILNSTSFIFWRFFKIGS